MKKILYVEDNEMNRDMLGRRLSRRDYEVIFAFAGHEGLDKMKSENPDLVLMDMETDKQKALDCGADDFDTKPVDFKRLLEKIEQKI